MFSCRPGLLKSFTNGAPSLLSEDILDECLCKYVTSEFLCLDGLGFRNVFRVGSMAIIDMLLLLPSRFNLHSHKERIHNSDVLCCCYNE